MDDNVISFEHVRSTRTIEEVRAKIRARRLQIKKRKDEKRASDERKKNNDRIIRELGLRKAKPQ